MLMICEQLKKKKRKNLVVCMTSIVYRHEKERGRLAFLSYSFVFPCTFSFGFSIRLITQSFNLYAQLNKSRPDGWLNSS